MTEPFEKEAVIFNNHILFNIFYEHIETLKKKTQQSLGVLSLQYLNELLWYWQFNNFTRVLG